MITVIKCLLLKIKKFIDSFIDNLFMILIYVKLIYSFV